MKNKNSQIEPKNHPIERLGREKLNVNWMSPK